ENHDDRLAAAQQIVQRLEPPALPPGGASAQADPAGDQPLDRPVEPGAVRNLLSQAHAMILVPDRLLRGLSYRKPAAAQCFLALRALPAGADQAVAQGDSA